MLLHYQLGLRGFKTIKRTFSIDGGKGPLGKDLELGRKKG